ncbi:pyruvate kinase [Candidatus Avelusimicrobium facis]|uniref:pyruvate kinase n=1 Tax=Candidatus Avelusimicrobium facis TaxID=3416203 RepID=UPI0015B76134
MLIHDTFCKIIATVGPASESPQMLEKLVRAGVSVFRINFSHGTEEEVTARFAAIRALEKKYDISLGILCDLQGPKLRVGTFANGAVQLKEGQAFTLDMTGVPGDETRVTLPHPEIFKAMHPGLELLLNDGLIRLRVERVEGDKALTTVTVGGTLSDHKGVNVPGVKLPISALTEKDRTDLKLAEKLGADFIGLSFVQQPEDLLELRSLMTGTADIISKIEKPSAIEHLNEIVALSDAVMVARGDLGVEVSTEMVPVLQRRIVDACRKVGKPVIIATQMLESMITHITPTRAEASDVATAVYDGVDAVMLSGETAAGSYPVQAVSTMHNIIKTVEGDERYRKNLIRRDKIDGQNAETAITVAAGISARAVQTANIIANFTDSGKTTLRTAKYRPGVSILSLTPKVATARHMALVWGVTSVLVPDLTSFEDIAEQARQAALRSGLVQKGQNMVITAGIPFGRSGETNLLYIITI